MPQMYCKRCGVPAYHQSVSDECIGCKVADWVTEESEITWDAIRNTSGSGEIMKQIQEMRTICKHCKFLMPPHKKDCTHCGAKDSKITLDDEEFDKMKEDLE